MPRADGAEAACASFGVVATPALPLIGLTTPGSPDAIDITTAYECCPQVKDRFDSYPPHLGPIKHLPPCPGISHLNLFCDGIIGLDAEISH
jgi:hypothetical protein